MEYFSIENLTLAVAILLALLILACIIIVLLIFNKVNIDFKGLNKSFKGLGQAIDSFLKIFDVPGMPWIIRGYLFLFMIFGITLLLSSVWVSLLKPDPYSFTPKSVASDLYSLSNDSLKLILGAIIGSLSLAAEKTWGNNSKSGTREKDKLKSVEKETKLPRSKPKAIKNSSVRRKTKTEEVES